MQYKTTVVMVWAMVGICVSGVAYLLAVHVVLGIKTAFAEDQVKFFYECSRKSVTANEGEAVEYLRHIIEYYPSGTKQAVGTHLDHTVEIARQMAFLRVIDRLRCITGYDYGDDPIEWILHYEHAESGINK